MEKKKQAKVVKAENKLVKIKHIFTEEEKASIAQNLTSLMATLEDKEAELKAIKANFKTSIDDLEKSIRSLSIDYRLGWEYIEMECEVALDYTKKLRRYHDPRTGEILKEAPQPS